MQPRRAVGRRCSLGALGEERAAAYLQQQGYVLRARNWRHEHGELDIVAERDSVIVFVEVRTRRSDRFGAAEESITQHKRARLIATAQAYLEAHNLQDAQWQIDVIAIRVASDGGDLCLQHIPCAIEGA